jgi:hypothetical protein
LGLLDIFRSASLTRTAARTPAPIEGALAESGMGNGAFLGPGRPLSPTQGYSGAARRNDYPVGGNIAVNSRAAYGRTSWDVLRELIRAYGVAQDCKNKKIDEIRSMELLFTPMDGATGDTKMAVEAAKAALAFPDREHPYQEWVALWLENMLTFDAGPLKYRRNMNGDVIGLEVIDGPTIAPYVDEHGRRPKAPAPAFAQVIKGQVFQWFTDEDMLYTRFRPQTDSPFGMAPLESILVSINTDMRYQWHLLQMFTEGSIPGGFMEVPPDMSSPDQVAEWQDYWDALYMGDQSITHKMVAVPNQSKFTGTTPAAFDKAFPEYLAVQVCRAFGVVPSDIGILSDVNRATGETQADTQFRVNTLPWVQFVQNILTYYVQKGLGLPVEVRLNTGREKEDRLADAQVWKIAVETGMVSMDEAREELFGLPTDNQRPIPRGIISPRTGFIPLESLLNIAGPIDPETKAPDHAAALDEQPFGGSPGVLADKLPGEPALHRAPIDPDEPQFPDREGAQPGTGTIAPPTVAKELAKWRASSRQRIKRGAAVRKFESDVIPAPVIERVWADLQKSATTADVDAAFAKADTAAGADASPKAPPAGTPKPSWRDLPAVTAPQHSVDLQLTDHWTPKVQDAIMQLWADTDLQAATSAADGLGDVALGVYRRVARETLLDRMDASALDGVIRSAWADAYNVGTMAAQVQMGQVPTGWDSWKPGFANPDMITGGGGWQAALDNAGIRLAGITDTTMDRLTAAIEKGVVAGDSVDGLAKSLNTILDDPNRAELIAHTETARLVTNAAMDQYAAMGVKQWDLVVSAGVCPVCSAIAMENPHTVGDSDSKPPIHPRCRCAAAPHIEGTNP